MADTNENKFSGTIERLKSIPTKTGNSMATCLLSVGQNKFKWPALATWLMLCCNAMTGPRSRSNVNH